MVSPAEHDHIHTPAFHEEIVFSPEWFRHPRLIAVPTVFPVGSPDTRTEGMVMELKNRIITVLSTEFEQRGCSVNRWNGNPVENSSGPLVAINPVFIGELPDRAKDALVHADTHRFTADLREYLPELPDPLTQTIGSKQMKLEPSIHPNFTNMVFVDDSGGLIRNLSDTRTVMFSRFLMAKLGAFKTIIVPYSREDGNLRLDHLTLATLEGGHPNLSVQEVAQRLMVFGSAREVGGFSVDPDLTISQEYWDRSSTVEAIRLFGQFLGDYNLLSPPIEIADLVKDPHLAEKIIRLLDYTRQAEGALWAIDPNIEIHSRTKFFNRSVGALPLVTASGTSGAVKTNLDRSDIIPVLPQSDGAIRGISVGGIPPRKASVEAEEFTLPLLKLPRVRVNGRVLPAFRAGFHIHRGFKTPATDRIAVISTHVTRFPPVGCGVDLMHGMSFDAMRRASDVVAAGGRAKLYLFAVPNHGTNGFIPWHNTNGEIDSDPYEPVMEAIERGDLVFTPGVPQV